jgi:hypothetical protein
MMRMPYKGNLDEKKEEVSDFLNVTEVLLLVTTSDAHFIKNMNDKVCEKYLK